MFKFILTAVIIYFLVRSITNKPWKNNQIHIHQTKSPDKNRQNEPFENEQEDYVDYEEID